HSSSIVDTSGEYDVGGLVGIITSDSSVENCSSQGKVRGSLYTGGLIGFNVRGVISRCSATGDVDGVEAAGGLIGRTEKGIVKESFATGSVSGLRGVGGIIGSYFTPYTREGYVLNCYSTGNVSGEGSVGGLIGSIVYQCTVSNCYSTGLVDGTGEHIGGLVGRNDRSIVEGSFWDIEASGITSSSGGYGRTTSQMKSRRNYFDWNFFSVWWIDEDRDQPRLYWEPGSPPQKSFSGEGLGTEVSPYIVTNVTQLVEINLDLTANYILGDSLDLTVPTSLIVGEDFLPIAWDESSGLGHQERTFTGEFDGRGHSISNLFIGSPTRDYGGLFGFIEEATIQNVNLEGFDVRGGEYVGGLCGYNDKSVVLSCSASTSLHGE
ncbi:MAG: hypothetical protein KC994_26800, partial [Candidatus Omnitrophica bacterium]|nr:hypothetical protein [Candidatus Omnitrophota bacterium]